MRGDAERYLAEPSSHPGLPVRRQADELVRVWTQPAFTPWACWALYRDGDGYVVRRVVIGPRPPSRELASFAAEARVPVATADRLLGAVDALVVPAFQRRSRVGLDGVIRGIAVGSYMAGAEYRWWCDPPPGWRVLADLHQDLVSSLHPLLPAPSLDLAGTV